MDVFKEKLNELIKKGTITEEDAVIPDYGPLPEFEDSPPPEEEEEEEGEEDEEDEEEEEEEEDDSDDEGRRRRGRNRGRQSGRTDRGDDGDDPHRKRGRPPKVFTPLEARIDAILKGLRRYKSKDGQLAINQFEKLPDKADLPEYFATITEPIALDMIKKKYKRKKYQNVDQLVRDLDLMFENAKKFNEEGSEVYEDAVELQKEAHLVAEQQKARPDDDFRDEDGKLPLASIEHAGQVWRVGKYLDNVVPVCVVLLTCYRRLGPYPESQRPLQAHCRPDLPDMVRQVWAEVGERLLVFPARADCASV